MPPFRTAGPLLVLWVVLAWWFFFPPAPAIVEYCFSLRWYRWIVGLMTPLTQSARFPIFSALLFIAFAVFIVLFTRSWIRIRRAGGCFGWAGLLWGARLLFLVLPVLAVWFIAFWGAGYRRMPVEERLRFDITPLSDAEAARLRGLLLDEVRLSLTPPGQREPDRAIASIASAMAGVVATWDGRPIKLPFRVKAAPRGLLLSNGTSGMCVPFTLEAIVDGGLPDAAFVYSAAHELGHIAGFCAEDEASFVGYIAGLQSDDPFARYACALNAYTDLIGRLRGEDYRQAFEALPGIAKQDLRKVIEAYRRYRVAWVSRISWQAYDQYLQAQGIPEGVQNYSYGITLLGYAWRKGLIAGSRP